jgi:hypothetical protein|tara:strand:- start:5546 stop:6766 length:1221 start_codon:yes stop_codon:yes gene_type:complete
MANKNLLSLAESDPNFSNQALENAINNLKIGWVAKSIILDDTITSNAVLTNSQKTDLKSTINNHAHLNLGRQFNDMLRHTNTVLDGSIIPATSIAEQRTFLDLLQNVQSVQGLVIDLFGVDATDKNRGVNDHFGTLNNIFLETEDSTKPVFDSLRDSIDFITRAELTTDTVYQNAITDLTNFINGLVADSTDFQQSLDSLATAMATASTNLHNALGSEPYLTERTKLVNNTNSILTQVTLEKTNLTTIESYVKSLTDNVAFTGLAEDTGLRNLMSKVAQNPNWIKYFTEFEDSGINLNPLFDTETDSDKSAILEEALAAKGLPDVLDADDLQAVAKKARLDDRIDSSGFDFLTIEQIIEKSCQQLGLDLFGTVRNQSKRLLSNLNQRDRDLTLADLNANEDSNTLS